MAWKDLASNECITKNDITSLTEARPLDGIIGFWNDSAKTLIKCNGSNIFQRYESVYNNANDVPMGIVRGTFSNTPNGTEDDLLITFIGINGEQCQFFFKGWPKKLYVRMFFDDWSKWSHITDLGI